MWYASRSLIHIDLCSNYWWSHILHGEYSPNLILKAIGSLFLYWDSWDLLAAVNVPLLNCFAKLVISSAMVVSFAIFRPPSSSKSVKWLRQITKRQEQHHVNILVFNQNESFSPLEDLLLNLSTAYSNENHPPIQVFFRRKYRNKIHLKNGQNRICAFRLLSSLRKHNYGRSP